MKQWKKSLLTKVITRIDYEDQIEISSEKYLRLKDSCIQNNIDQIDNRTLEPEHDFATSDAVPFRNLPEEYIKKINCKIFYNQEFKLEVNPFFMRVIQSATSNYQNYQKNHLQIVDDAFNILDIPNTQIQRISIRKCDEIYYESIAAMARYFKNEIIQNNIFGPKQNWDIPQSESHVAQNFMYDDFRINFLRHIDRGTIPEKSPDNPETYTEKILYRLFLDYEVYTRDAVDNYREVLLRTNTITESLFEETFNEEGKKILYDGGSFDNYVFL